jgi:mitogen-activated protein kinase 1/3
MAEKKEDVKTASKAAAPTKKPFVASGSTFVVPKNYEFIKEIGKGSYGIVCAAYDRDKDRKVAIKKVPNAFKDLVNAKRIVREIKLLEYLHHDNIISLYDVLRPESKTSFEDIYFVNDLMETDLSRVIYSHQPLTDDHIQYFIYQLLKGVLYLHSASVIHRDLKPGNLLVNRKCELKICDFGLARGFASEESHDPYTGYVVTRWYRAPDVILNESHYTKAIDLWSVGCVMAELLGRMPLFKGQDYVDQIKRIITVLGTPSPEDLAYFENEQAAKYIASWPKVERRPWNVLFPKANPVALDLLDKLLVFNPVKRYTAEQCLSHPYFEALHNDKTEPRCPAPFDWKFDDFAPTKAKLQEMIYELSLHYHPE